MESKKSVKITTPAQFSKLVEIMEAKSYLAKGYNKGLNKINIKDEWNEIAEELNSIGPPFRTGEGWLKVWGDFKFKLKKKLSHNKAESHATGGGAFKQFVFTPVEEAAVSLLELHSIVQHKEPFGLKRCNFPKQGLSTEKEFDIVIEEIVETSTPAKKPKRNASGATADLSLIEEPCCSINLNKYLFKFYTTNTRNIFKLTFCQAKKINCIAALIVFYMIFGIIKVSFVF